MEKRLTLKNFLKEKRLEKGLSQIELAYLVGTTRQTIYAIEKQIFLPTVKLALLLSVALDCKVEELFYF